MKGRNAIRSTAIPTAKASATARAKSIWARLSTPEVSWVV